MSFSDIRSKCKVKIGTVTDEFVGIRSDNGDLSIIFPIGFELSLNDQDLRNDIFLLFKVLSKHLFTKNSEILLFYGSSYENHFPINSYINLMIDYLNRGIYKEKATYFSGTKRGRISWKRTIAEKQVHVSSGNIVYLEFVSKVNSNSDDEVISKIHEFLIYESFQKIGWLFTPHLPKKPTIKFDKKLFLSKLVSKFSNTYNDVDKFLFQNMINIVNYLEASKSTTNFSFGTNRFEYIWESMIDNVYGSDKKIDYFPLSFWKLEDVIVRNSVLIPDTIMKSGNDIFVLDAKYYRYGITRKPYDLPGTSSILKQIAYAEHIGNISSLSIESNIFSVFLLPFSSGVSKSTKYEVIGSGYSSWKDNTKTFHEIIAILVDTKSLMKKSFHKDCKESSTLSSIVRDYFLY